MELKPNMYVRTKDGKIFDCYVSEQMGKPIYYPKCSKTNGYIDWNEVYKKSENIIDILEVGDYVNGEKVDYIDDCDGAMREYYYDYEDASIDVGHYFEEIKSIVTKEQFSSIEYRLGDDK